MLWNIFPPFLNRTWKWEHHVGVSCSQKTADYCTVNLQWFVNISIADGWQLSLLTTAFHLCHMVLDIHIFTSLRIFSTPLHRDHKAATQNVFKYLENSYMHMEDISQNCQLWKIHSGNRSTFSRSVMSFAQGLVLSHFLNITWWSYSVSQALSRSKTKPSFFCIWKLLCFFFLKESENFLSTGLCRASSTNIHGHELMKV